MLLILRKIWFLLSKREKAVVLVLFALMLVSSFLDLLGIGLVVPVIALLSKPALIEQNKYLKLIYDMLAPHSYESFLVILCLALIVLYVGKNAFLALQNYWQAHFIMGKGADLAIKLFDNYIHAPYEFHAQRNSGTLIGKINLADALAVNLLVPFMIILTEALVVLLIFVTLLLLAPFVTLALVAAILFITAAVYLPLRRINSRLGVIYKDEQLAMNKYALQGLQAFKESKVRNAEDFFAQEYAVHRRAFNDANAKIVFMGNLPRFLVEGMLVSLGLGGLLVLLVTGMPPGSIVLTLSLFAASAVRIMPSLTRIQYNLTRILHASPVLITVFDDIAAFEKEHKAKGQLNFAHTIKLDRVTFGYSGTETKVLEEFSLVIKKNSSVAFIGPTGCGKTTLVDIILGLLKPQKGAVLVDGQNIQQGLKSWQSKIGYVPQFIFLLDHTVKANVAFGVPEDEIDDNRVIECLKMAQIYAFIASLPNGIAHVVGENGVQLSGGQRQRIGIARALYHDPEVLVLDEATSSLDTDTEKAFIDALNNLKGKLTIIMIAHRLSTVEKCDYIVDLGQVGRTRGRGPS